jgi:hypothetical protein
VQSEQTHRLDGSPASAVRMHRFRDGKDTHHPGSTAVTSRAGRDSVQATITAVTVAADPTRGMVPPSTHLSTELR